MGKTQKITSYYKVLFAGLFISLFPAVAFAASLTFSPQSGTYTAGSKITVNIYVSSSDQSMNAVSGALSFPTDLLSVSSVSKSNSIISLWTIEPTFSNSAGSVNFEGIVLNPGFTGSDGKIISITFTAKSVGTANIGFDSGSVLANDGTGTSLPTTFGKAQFVITPGAPSVSSPSQTNAPATTSAPIIPAVIPPVINFYPRVIYRGDQIVVQGTSRYPNSKVIVWLKYNSEDAKSSTITNTASGDFTFANTDAAKEGTYEFWTQSVDQNGAVSTSSPIYTILVISPFTVVIFGMKINIFVGLLLLLILLLILMWLISKRAKKERTKSEADAMVTNANKLANTKFSYFNDYVNAQLNVLENDEKIKSMQGSLEVIENVKKHIADFKEFIDKEQK